MKLFSEYPKPYAVAAADRVLFWRMLWVGYLLTLIA